MFRMKNKGLSGMDKVKLQRNFLTYSVLIVALGAMTFFGVCDPGSSVMGPKGSAATVAGEVITRNEFDRAYRAAYDRYSRMYADSFDPAALELAKTVMKQLVDERLLFLKATDLGLRASDEEVFALLRNEEIFKDEKGNFSEEQLTRFLDGNGYTEASFTQEVRRNVTVQKLRRFVSETSYVSSKSAEIDFRLAETKLDIEYLKFDPQKLEVKVDAADIDKYLAVEANKAKVKETFTTNAKEYNAPEQVKGRHILIGFKESRNASPEAAKRSKEQAKARADEIAAKVKAPGADFTAIAKEMTDEAAGKTTGGDLGWFSKETMVKEFSDAAFAMNKGDISAPVESPFGFHIIQVEDKKAAVTKTLEEVERTIAESTLSKEKRPELAKQQASKVLADLTAGNADESMKSAGVTWTATGEFAADTRYLPGIGSSQEVNDAVAGLTKVGELYPSLVDVRGNLYIMRLKARKNADMANFSAEKKKQLTSTASYAEGSSLFTAYEKLFRQEMEKKETIKTNEEYIAIDQRNSSRSKGGG
jgi:peptidyl-prolyl cis-trans isomerase D